MGSATSYIAGELRAQRARLAWTVEALAERSGVPKSTVDRAMRGESALSVEVLIPLCAALGLDVGELIDQAARQAR